MMDSARLFLRQLLANCIADSILRHSAAIAYYAAFSIPAFTLIVLSIAGQIIGPVAAQDELFARLRETIGPDVTTLLQSTLANMQSHGSSSFFQSISVVLLIIAAIGIFREVQASLNDILEATPQGGAFMHHLRSFVLSFVLIVLTAVLLAVAVGLSAILQLLSARAGEYLSIQFNVLNLINSLVSEGSMIILFFLLYTVLPARKFPHLATLVCSIISSTLLLGGTFILTYYIARSNIGAVYGVAASLLTLLFWVYYAVNIFFLGAEMLDTWVVHTDKRPGKLKPFFVDRKLQ